MSTTAERPGPPWLPIGLAILAASAAVTGAWQLLAPQSFYDGFPGLGHVWVALLPPYNDHLMRDVGEANLAFGALLTWAGVTPRRRGAPARVGWLVSAVPHFLYHLGHLAHFAPADAVAQTLSLGLVVALPLALLTAGVGLGRSA